MKRAGIVVGILLLAATAPGWDMRRHHLLAEEAVLAVPEEVPAFFRWGARTVGHTAIDPDVMKQRDTPQLRHREYPEHFLDYELVGGATLPAQRYDFVELVREHGEAPDRVGFVPYAITENTQRLTLAFAEYRCWPDNPSIRAKALVYAGLLAHYATDMAQPLHTSVHYDGRAAADGESPHSGIHRKMDSLFGQDGFRPPEAPIRPLAFDETWAAVQAEFAASHALVDTVYGLEPQLDALYEEGFWAETLRVFAAERYHATVEFLASLYLTAWEQSADIEFSERFARQRPDGTWGTCASQ